MYFCMLDSLQEFCYFCNFWSTHPSPTILLQFSQYNGYVGDHCIGTRAEPLCLIS